MTRRFLINVVILLFSVGVFIFTFSYGPMRRSFVSPGRSQHVSTTGDIVTLWESTAVRGRIAVLFTRRLNGEVDPASNTEVKYIQYAMKHGIVRTVFHFVPDSAWPEVSENLTHWPTVKRDRDGFVGIFEDGRVYIHPLSQFKPISEKALVVIEPKIWSKDELEHIARTVQQGELTTDLLTVIRGALSDSELFSDALSSERAPIGRGSR